MYAVIRAGGKQYRVAPGDVIRVEKFPTIDGPVEFGEVVEQGRSPKILVFHYKRKKQYKKLRGHRQAFTAVRITEIAFDGQSFRAPEQPNRVAKPKPVAADQAEIEESPKAHAKSAKSSAPKKAAPKKAAAKKAAAKKKK